MLCAGITLIYADPQTSELPNYPRNYRPQPFTSKAETDRSTAASQSAKSYIDNPYLYQNQIPIRQKPIQQVRPGKNSHFKNEQERLDDVCRRGYVKSVTFLINYFVEAAKRIRRRRT